MGQFAGQPSPLRDKTTQPIVKTLTQISDFLTVFFFVLSKVEDNVVRTAYLLELTVHEK